MADFYNTFLQAILVLNKTEVDYVEVGFIALGGRAGLIIG
ncbi:hypothetical protein Xenpb_03634 [Xenorhabdus sp. PB62.4]|nr:hypothetical protein [Xenorhabdus sp. PB62.4]